MHLEEPRVGEGADGSPEAQDLGQGAVPCLPLSNSGSMNGRVSV